MSTLPVTLPFEGGSDGTVMTAAPAGFDTMTNPSSLITFSATQKHAGALSMRCAQPATAVQSYGVLSGWGTLTTDVWVRMYLFVSGVATANLMLAWRTATDTASSYWGLNATGKVVLQNAAGTASITSTTTIAANTWYRLEGRIRSSTTAGNLEMRLYAGANLETNTATEAPAAVTNAVLAANTGGCRVCPSGVTGGGPGTSITGYLDDVLFTAAGWPGPAASPSSIARRRMIAESVRRRAGTGVFPMYGWRAGRRGLCIAEKRLWTPQRQREHAGT